MEASASSPELTSIQPQVLSAATPKSRALKIAPAKGWRFRESAFVHFLILFLITLLGGALRFLYLDRPSIWGDEAATFARVCGTFPELMTRLQTAGFAPVHYELYWWIGQHRVLTPFMMRLVPAIAGTLMIPAMYWLAAQLIGRRAALLTALLTATSAYLLNYSRDAKMYSPFWFFAVVNVAALLWWLRVRTPLNWCLWIASGTAMVGFDALGWITVAVELFIVLTARNGNWLSLLRLVILFIFSAIDWILSIGVVVLLFLIAAHGLMGSHKWLAIAVLSVAVLRIIWLILSVLRSRDASGRTSWIREVLRWPTERMIARPWIANRIVAFRWPPLVLFVFGLLIMLAGPFGYYYDFNRFLEHVDAQWNGTGIEWVEAYNAGRSGPSLVGFTASSFLISWEWPRAKDQSSVAPRTLRLLTAGTLSIAAVLALGLLPFPWARKLHPTPGITGWRSALWMTLWICVPPYAFYCVSLKNHGGPRSWLNVSRDFLQASPWIAVGVGVLALIWIFVAGNNWRLRFLRIAQFLLIVVVALTATEGFYLIYPKIDAALSAHSSGWREHTSVWMPRYVAVVLPPFLIVITTLLWRLPTRPLRWGAILLFITVNLGVHSARVFAASEPPSGLIAHDILDSLTSDKGDGSRRAYFQSSMQVFGAGPGSIGLHSDVMHYYIAIFSPHATLPNRVDDSLLRYRIRPGRFIWLTFSGFIINEVRNSPKLKTFITWDKIDPGQVDLTNKPLDALEPDWRLASEQTFPVRDHWRWMDYCTVRRRVYVRTPATQP